MGDKKSSDYEKLIGHLVVVSHWRDAKLEDATKLGILDRLEDGYFYIKGDNRGYRYCHEVSMGFDLNGRGIMY